MTRASLNQLPSQSRQRGTVLIIALVFLLLMTLIGVAAMQGTTLQERMSGNHRDRNLAFQAAEAALREGERWLDIAANRALADDPNNQPLLDAADWDGTENPNPGNAPVTIGEIADLDAQLADPPTFHVGPPRLALLDAADPSAGLRSLYPVTTRAVGGSDTAVVILQSHCELPCRP